MSATKLPRLELFEVIDVGGCAGIGPNACSNALGYTLINLLTDHYSEEHAMLSLEELQAMLKRCYEAGLGPSAKSAATVSPP